MDEGKRLCEERPVEEEAYYVPVGNEIELFAAAYDNNLPINLKGPNGCGKTRFMEYMAYHLGRPLIAISCHEDLTASDLIGRFLLKGECTVWGDGPLTKAVRYGFICYLDEDFKKIPEGLNNILDGVVVPINETTRLAVELSKGHLDARFEGDTEGEFKQLAQSVNYFTKLLDVIINESNEVLVAMEKEDFSRRVHFHGHGDLKILTEGIEQKRISLQQASIDRQVAEQELKEYARKLEQSNELKDMFTDIMRHDLLNPASGIKGFTELLLMDEEDEQTKKFLERILNNSNNLIEMIHSAAEFAKVESSDELELKIQDITTIIEHSIEILTTQASNKEIVIEFNERKPHYILANPIIETVFTNLISNAIKYSPEKSEVIVEIKESNNLTEITVTDFGEGIKDEHKTTVFDRFKRVNKTGVKGSGLGLAIVKRTIELHDGDVGVRDNPSGKGSIFFVELKRYDDEPEDPGDQTAKTYQFEKD